MEATELPIEDALPGLCAALAQGPNAVLVAPPGAGKTTRVPLALMDQDWADGARILMLEPRRVAARAAAERLAAQLGERPGQRVGYRIRGDSKPGTRIEVITEGVLTRMLHTAPDLPGIAAVLFDEVHERSIHCDLGLAFCIEAQEALRPDLKLLTMSATVDAVGYAALLGDAPVIRSEGRMFPVETRWLDKPWKRPNARRDDFVRQAAALIEHAFVQTEGDVLAFLPGAGEIRQVAALQPDAVPTQALYGAMPFKDQQAVLRETPDGARRVVLATNIAETSLTVPGVRVVVDCGLTRRATIDPGTGLSRLVTVPVSRAEAEQRRGRAGRVAPGTCFRMWTKGEEGGLPAFAPPEICDADLTQLALDLAAWGASDAGELRFLDAPPEARLKAAQDLLRQLSALDAGNRITAHGRDMAAKPVHPRLAHMLIRGEAEGLGPEAALLAATLAERSPLRTHRTDLSERLRAVLHPGPESDRGVIQRVLQDARRLHTGKTTLAKITGAAGRLAALAYPDRIAFLRASSTSRYLLSSGRGAILDEKDPLAGQAALVATDLEDGREARIRCAIPVAPSDIREMYADQIVRAQTAKWSTQTGQVEARDREMLGAVALSDRPWKDAPAEALGRALADGIREKGIAALPWSKPALSLRARATWVRAHADDPDRLPDWSDTALVASLDDWLMPHLSGMTRLEHLSRLDLNAILRAQLDWDAQTRLDRIAPARFTTPLGSAVHVDFSGEKPSISVRVQELYGLTVHPTVGLPPVPLEITLLSPANRPVQTTSDLPGFWTGSYSDVRKDMRARYPKHHWPEDPTSAVPDLKTHRRRRVRD